MSIERYRIAPPADDATPRECSHHPGSTMAYVAIPVATVDTDEPAMVRGWACPRCWTPRGFVVDGDLERGGTPA